MKNTKKILMILIACVLLVGTAFVCIASAATGIIAGEQTKVDEYLTFKKVASDDMESGNSSLITFIGNLKDVSIENKKYVEGVRRWNEYRQGIPGVYDEDGTVSDYFFVFDYNYNPGGVHLYVEPVLGVLNNIDKTPSKGFVSEFDIAFLTELVDVPDTTKPRYNEDGSPMLDANGEQMYEPIMRHELARVVENGKVRWLPTYIDSEGNEVTEPKLEPVWVPVSDEQGRPVIYDGTEKVMVPVYDEVTGQIVLDENKRVILVEKTDDQGNPVYQTAGEPAMALKETPLQVEGEFQNHNQDFSIDMLNTGTMKDGSKSVMSFKTDAAKKTITVTVKNNLDAEANASKYVFAADEWAHFSVQYVAETMMTYIYAGRDTDEGGRILIGQIDGLGAAENQGGALVPVYPLRLRMGSRSTSGIVALDNFLSYQGVTIHDPDFIKKVEENDAHGMLKYFVSILDNANGKQSPIARLYAYDDISEYVIKDYYSNGNYVGASLSDIAVKNAVDKYLEYAGDVDGVYTNLVALAKDENATEFARLVEKVYSLERNLSNAQTRSDGVAVAEEFLAANGGLINRTGTVYTTADQHLKEIKAAITADNAATEFIHYMNLYTSSVNYGANVTRIKSHVEAASKYFVGLVEISDYSNLKAADKTSLDAAIEKFLGNEEKGILSAVEMIEQNTASWNSTRFIGIIELIKSYGLTEEVFANDNGTIRSLWKIALDITRKVDGDYDADAEGFAVAYVDFQTIHAYFWVTIQNEHIEAIQSKLDTFNNADMSYVAKQGICKYVDKYFEANANYIDPENETIAALKARNEVYKEQFEALENDYVNLLTQNTVKFVNIISYMQEMSTYAEIKASFAEATEYYYGMDLVYDMNNDGKNDIDIDGAVAAYEEFREYISAVEEDSAMFVANAAILANASSKEDVYAALVACYSCTENLDASYNGAAEAIAIYEAEYAEYNGNAKLITEQIKETTEVVCSTRGNWSFDGIVAFVRNLFN